MRRQIFCFVSGRGGACAALGAVLGLVLSGCSANVSRFDAPLFASADTENQTADYATTSALPPVLPQESVYASGTSAGVQQASLPPASYSPQPRQAAYSPAPSGRMRAPQANYPAPAHPAPEPAVWTPKKVSGAHHKVEKGETLSMLSRRYGVSVEAIMAANNLPDGRLSAGQEIVIPGASAPKPHVAKAEPKPAPASSPAPATKPADAAANEPASEAAPKTETAEAAPKQDGTPDVRVVKTTTILPPGASSLAEEEASDAAGKAGEGASPDVTGEGGKQIASVEQLPNPDPMSGNSFRWPVKGRIISQFGTRADGRHNDGIDVAVPQGTPVQAAENGVVAYAGSELKGYGNLVLIRHANNWVSAYAHNEELLVKRGDKVKRGQVIAKAGATGSVSQPLVHFELRKGSRPVDPTKYMSDATASAE
ncbi:MAG TPA: M23 family metallopeptidase [Methyloceanibacter sp.]|nr:M23 family metallopeptidase [Methyloceanibacter sp.]